MADTRGWLLLIGFVLGAAALWFFWPSSGERIDSTRARGLVRDGARLVDVRTPDEYRAGHIQGARNVPLQELGSRIQELEPRDAPIVVYCRSGRRSAAAREQLVRAGFTKVYDLGPLSAW